MGGKELERIGVIENPKGFGYVVNLFEKGETNWSNASARQKHSLCK